MEYFYKGLIRKYTIAFGKIFTEISIQREDPYGNVAQTIRVPLTYASKDKFITVYKQENRADTIRPPSILLPRISYVLKTIEYDDERKTNQMLVYSNKSSSQNDSGDYTFNPIPYNFGFSVSVWTKNVSDIYQILEQILPQFQPFMSVTINEFPELEIKRDVPIELSTTNLSVDVDTDLTEEASSQRFVRCDLDFIVKGYLYPRYNVSAIIKRVYTNLHTYIDENDPYTYAVNVEMLDEVVPWDSNFEDNWAINHYVNENISNFSGFSGTSGSGVFGVSWYPTGYSFIDPNNNLFLAGASPESETTAQEELGVFGNYQYQFHQSSINTMSTGLAWGGLITQESLTTYKISAGRGYIINNAEKTPSLRYITWADKEGLTPEFTDNESFIGIDSDGSIYETHNPFTPDEHRTYIFIGTVGHRYADQVEYIIPQQQYNSDVFSQFIDFVEAFGSFNVNGNDIIPWYDLHIRKTGGSIFINNINYQNDPNSPNIFECPDSTGAGVAPWKQYYYRDSNGDWVNNLNPVDHLDPDHYDAVNDVLGVVPDNYWTIQIVTYYGPLNMIDIQYGSVCYPTYNEAYASMQKRITINPYNANFDVFRAWIIIKQGATDISDTSQVVIVPAAKNGFMSQAYGTGTTTGNTIGVNIGNSGEGLYEGKSGITLEFLNIAGNGKISVTKDDVNKNLVLDLIEPYGDSGFSGISGFSGYSGSGISGYSGFSGSGQSGYSGFSGLSGYSGINGVIGINGASGYSGLSGTSGYSGGTGEDGTAGTSGYSGYSGNSTSGYSGYSGKNGVLGGDGLSGYSGYSGKEGDIGNRGISGYSGYSGQEGSIGQSGKSGYSGQRGNAGLSGISGYSGFMGNSGISGYSGRAGTSGYSGFRGISGYSGINGTNGSHGADGDSGISGYSGINGVIGVNGTSGYSGLSGISGYSGSNGTNGSSGISGYSGFSGISGYSGNSTSGYSGFSGISGYSGSNGTNGSSGISGYSGFSGISGYSESGISGYSGFSGISGYSGIAATFKNWENHGNHIARAQAAASLVFWPVFVPGSISFSSAYMHISMTIANAAGTASFGLGLYSNNASTLSLISSVATVYSWASGAATVNYTGARKIIFGLTNTLTPGNAYFFGMYLSTGGAGTYSVHGQSNAGFIGDFGAASTTLAKLKVGLGSVAATGTAMPTSQALSSIQGTGITAEPWILLTGESV